MVVKVIDPMWGTPAKGDWDWQPEPPPTELEKGVSFMNKYGGSSKPLKVPKTSLKATYAVSELDQQLKNMGGLSSAQAMALEPSFSIEKSAHTQSYLVTMELSQSVFHVTVGSYLLEQVAASKNEAQLATLTEDVADGMLSDLHDKIVEYLKAAWS